ncbi:hypothetical protein CBOM_07704 [Ceraceosorus bombacis]|uniref:Uncharacterized protein n=1 Tax=Ceraceosorus bombacis TaxID=401625 RepID=A0A0P1BGN2_9BASI|nr:hypothetical protein CBOM_07704 [Ceraceosorus bombacis]
MYDQKRTACSSHTPSQRKGQRVMPHSSHEGRPHSDDIIPSRKVLGDASWGNPHIMGRTASVPERPFTPFGANSS